MHGLKRVCQVFQRSESSANIVHAVQPGPSFDHNENGDKCKLRTELMN